jgi:predicted amidohydrolase YtcJ
MRCFHYTKLLLAASFLGAYASFEEQRKGRPKAGMLADVIVFSQDLFQIPPSDIFRARVVLTVIDGRTIHNELE